MRSIIVFAAIAAASFFGSSGLHAQSNPVPDSSFESWSAGQPAGWVADSSVFQSSDAHSGSWAAGGIVSPSGSVPILQTYFPVKYVPGVLEGYYKFTSVGGDEIMFFAVISARGAPAAQAFFVDSASNTEYEHFIAPFSYSNEEMPDTAAIIIELENPHGTLHAGTSFVVDDISLAGMSINPQVSVRPSPPASQLGLVQNYPNPFSRSTTISFPSSEGYAEISVTNLLGEEAAHIFSGELASGEHTFTWNTGENMPGMYECVVQMNGQVQRMPMLLIRN